MDYLKNIKPTKNYFSYSIYYFFLQHSFQLSGKIQVHFLFSLFLLYNSVEHQNTLNVTTQSAGAVEYTNCISAEW